MDTRPERIHFMTADREPGGASRDVRFWDPQQTSSQIGTRAVSIGLVRYYLYSSGWFRVSRFEIFVVTIRSDI
jgi:hypothetical protein